MHEAGSRWSRVRSREHRYSSLHADTLERRSIPSGALTGVQFIRTPSYVEVTGHIDQKMINIKDGDEGGELDSGGQDNRGK